MFCCLTRVTINWFYRIDNISVISFSYSLVYSLRTHCSLHYLGFGWRLQFYHTFSITFTFVFSQCLLFLAVIHFLENFLKCQEILNLLQKLCSEKMAQHTGHTTTLQFQNHRISALLLYWFEQLSSINPPQEV